MTRTLTALVDCSVAWITARVKASISPMTAAGYDCMVSVLVIDINCSGRNAKEMTAAAPVTTYVRKARVTVTQT